MALYTIFTAIIVLEKSFGNVITGEISCDEQFLKKELRYKQQINNLTEQLDALKKELDDRQKHHDSNLSPNRGVGSDSPKGNGGEYRRFDSNFIYGEEQVGDHHELRKRLDAKGGLDKQEIEDVINRSLKALKEGPNETASRSFKLFDGIYRHEPTLGTRYELTFADQGDPDRMTTFDLYRPYGMLRLVRKESKVFQNTTINIIVPLANKIERFRKFLDNFASVCTRQDRKVHLTVVYFGQDGLQQVRRAITYVSKRFSYNNALLLTLNETFSRARAIQVGMDYWNKSDVVVFTCDVDILFNNDFLNRCRVNASPGKRVYFPVVFSQYNPAIVRNSTGMELKENEIRLNENFGFWRHFGYGMSCMYRSDFLSVGGIDYESSVWGGEDVYLYRKFTRSALEVVRSVDPGIMHIWHEKKCDNNILGRQYRACVSSKVRAEGSQIQIASILLGQT